jgi:crotonobetainyl-CoA:carnitine CoA-transferase CaiB-like acyl-CoA transferase
VTEVVIAFQGGRAWRRHRQAAKRAPTRRYPARIARQVALAHALRRRLERGEFADFADMARQLGFTRARVTQLMDLLLAPEVQEEILFLELPPGAQPVSERGLREAVLGTIDWQEQRRRWEGLKGRLASVEHGREGATP